MRAAGAVLAALLALTGTALAQGAVPLAGMQTDVSAPIEAEADSLEVNQTDGSAIFRGNVLIVQDVLRLSADEVRVDYARGADGAQGRITKLTATGNVLLVSAAEQAEGQEAVYDVDAGVVTMKGGVLLTQGPNAISGETLEINLKDGTGTVGGRVRTVISPGSGRN